MQMKPNLKQEPYLDENVAVLWLWLFYSVKSVSLYLFIYLGFYVAFNTVQVISRRVVGRAEETST